MMLLMLLLLAGSAAGELRLVVYNTTAFGGPHIFNGTTRGGVSGSTTVGCNQSAEYVGTLTPPAESTLLGFATDVDLDVSTLRVWVGEFLVLQATTAAGAVLPAKLWYSEQRDAVTFCASPQCDTTQKASGYTVLSADEGSARNQNDASTLTPLYFSWSATNLDNWVTNRSDCPGAAYKSCGNPNGVVYKAAAAGRLELIAYSNAKGTRHMAAASPTMKSWAVAHGYTAQGTLGWLDPPGTAPTTQKTKRVDGSLALPANILAESPLPVRIHYARLCFGGAGGKPSPGHLSLLWRDKSSLATIPASALSPVLTDAQEAREAMRTRLYEPIVPWQTYVHSSMAAHTLQPSGMVLRLGIADLSSGFPDILGGASAGINPWPRFTPAHVIPGRHSLNGSDYTSFEVRRWGKHQGKGPLVARDARIIFQTTTLLESGGLCEGGDERCDLLALVSCKGTDCSTLAVTLSGSFEWGRTGSVALANTADVTFTAPGFPDITAFAASNITKALSEGEGGDGKIPRQFLRFNGGHAVGVSTGKRRDTSSISSAIAVAQARADVLPPRLQAVAALALPTLDVLAWNTLFTTSLHVYTPVSRNWAGVNDDAATTFVWDVFFAAVMFGVAGPEHPSTLRARDIAYANMITTVYSRTITGMVPNYRSGQGGRTCTYDRTEPMVGSWSLQILHSVFEDDWPLELLWPALFSWNQWVADRRYSEGSLGLRKPLGKTALVSLGSDGPPLVPRGLNTPHTLSAARYESGLDNSPQYDGNLDGNEGYGLGPLTFNGSTHNTPGNGMMELYDVAFTSYHAQDGRSLLGMSAAAGITGTKVDRIRQRVDATEMQLHRDLFDKDRRSYANKLYNGSFYPRWAPTVFSPMLLNSTPPDRIDGMMELLGNPSTFCVADEPSVEQPTILWRMQANNKGFIKAPNSITCASVACLQTTVLGVADFVSVEALVDVSQSPTASIALHRYTSASGDLCLSTTSPGPTYNYTNASAAPEGWCASKAGGAYTQALVLWHSKKRDDHRTCGGGTGCNATAMQAAGYEHVRNLCFARSSEDPKDLPCRYGLPSIHRSDEAFWDQIYWRGRIWAPQTYLVYAGLAKFAHVPSASAAKARLADQAKRLFLQQLELFGQVNENTNGVLGVGSDSVRADSYYHWGALHALVAIAEAGAYPSKML